MRIPRETPMDSSKQNAQQDRDQVLEGSSRRVCARIRAPVARSRIGRTSGQMV
ncbi:hypothetical protein AG1IA_09835 [Rhizoctonia solani AG-1 IA]|uniref:Uncharacterized protein n=1 Tax=Thanatephorus cucumeris (strain AG1-IA) TaxID=983506 RepID=L8WDW0_THACA|nr:hypothetical protein AG1IA_09835 [Rhizoctonia solani AG-1 IA]